MSTPISEVVVSKRACAALAAEGYELIEDLKGVPLATLAGLKGVGQVTLQSIQRALEPGDLPAEEPAEDSWEEGPQPIHLDSPYRDWGMRITDASETREGKRVRVILPIFLDFESGTARLTRELFFLAKYEGDKKRAKKALRDNEPWRLEAIEWLKEKPSYRNKRFIILTD